MQARASAGGGLICWLVVERLSRTLLRVQVRVRC